MFSNAGNIYDGFIELFETSITKISNFIFDVERSQSHNHLLAFSSIILSFASSYTTFHGFKEFFDNELVCFIITFGVQSLLLVSCWQIGALLSSRDTPVSLNLVFLISISISIFFSYTSLFKNLYVSSYYKSDILTLYTNAGEKTITKIHDMARENSSQLVTNITSKNNELTLEARRTIGNQITSINNNISILMGSATEYADLRKLEIEKGGTYIEKTNSYSTAGNGVVATEIRKNELRVINTKINPLSSKLLQLKETLKTLDTLANSFNSELNTLPLKAQLTHLKILDICIRYRMENSCSHKIPTLDFISFKKHIEYKEGDASEYFNIESASEIKVYVKNAIQNSPLSSEIKQDQARMFDQKTAPKENAHIFSSSIDELLNLNKLAIASILIAILLDLLILMCGLLGARQTSFLDIHKSSDLRLLKERALENILSINLEANEFDSIMTSKIKKIINIATFDDAKIEFGYSSYISFDNVESNELAKEVGILSDLELMAKFEDIEEKVFIKNTMVLWMADKLNKTVLANEFTGKTHAIVNEFKRKNNA